MAHEPPKCRHDTFVILDPNEAFCRLLGADREALIDRAIDSLIAYEDFAGLVRLRMKLLRSHGEIMPVILPLARFDGSVFWATIKTHPIGQGLYESELSEIKDE